MRVVHSNHLRVRRGTVWLIDWLLRDTGIVMGLQIDALPGLPRAIKIDPEKQPRPAAGEHDGPVLHHRQARLYGEGPYHCHRLRPRLALVAAPYLTVRHVGGQAEH